MKVPRKRDLISVVEKAARPRVPVPATPLSGGPEGPEGKEGPQGPEGKQGKEGAQGPAGKDGGGTLVGELKDWAGISLPTVEGQEFLWCDGTAISRSTYATLFARLCVSTTGNRTSGSKAMKSIPSTAGMKVGMPVSGTGIQAGTSIEAVNSGTEITLSKTANSTGNGGAFVVAPFGVGNETTTFNLPDLRGRSSVAPDDMGTADAGRISTGPQRLGGSGGAERHTLSTGEMPSHAHNINVDSGTAGAAFGLAQRGVSGLENKDQVQQSRALATGGGESHNNMPPFQVVNSIIRVA